MWLLQAALKTFSYGGLACPTENEPETKVETEVLFMTQPQNSHSITAAIFYSAHNSVLSLYRREFRPCGSLGHCWGYTDGLKGDLMRGGGIILVMTD